jgi:hypothetical protein
LNDVKAAEAALSVLLAPGVLKAKARLRSLSAASAGESRFRNLLADFVRRSSLQRAKAGRMIKNSNFYREDLKRTGLVSRELIKRI